MTLHLICNFFSKDDYLAKNFRSKNPDTHIFFLKRIDALNYSTKSRLWLIRLQIILHNLITTFQSVTFRVRPDYVVLDSHLGVCLYSVWQLIFFRRNRLILLGFILTERKNQILNKLRMLYFNYIVSRASMVVCQSRTEEALYKKIFSRFDNKFVSIPYATHVPQPKILDQNRSPYIVSAGRSFRDYDLIMDVFLDLKDYKLKIICDSFSAKKESGLPPNIKIIRNCYGANFLQELAGSSLVVIPLCVDRVSAGQMVFLQSMALGKPVITTDTSTTREYIQHLKTGFMVEIGDRVGWKRAIVHFMQDREAREEMGRAAREYYYQHHTHDHWVDTFLDILKNRNS